MSNQDTARQRLSQIRDQVSGITESQKPNLQFHRSDPRVGLLRIDNALKRNALSLEVLQVLREQLENFNRSPVDNVVRFLPPFNTRVLDDLEKAMFKADTKAIDQYSWLVDPDVWNKHREGLPRVLVLKTEGSCFCSGHDLNELRNMSYTETQQLFATCAEVMSMIRRCPIPVIGVIQGLATAAGAQLAFTTDIPIAHASTQFRLPGSAMGLSCISPSTAISRQLGNAFGYRMIALTDIFRADALPAGSLEVVKDEESLDDVVTKRTKFYTEQVAGQAQALGKWAYWTQAGISGNEAGDGYEAATIWSGRAMALLAQTPDSKEGVEAFLTKRKPIWRT